MFLSSRARNRFRHSITATTADPPHIIFFTDFQWILFIFKHHFTSFEHLTVDCDCVCAATANIFEGRHIVNMDEMKLKINLQAYPWIWKEITNGMNGIERKRTVLLNSSILSTYGTRAADIEWIGLLLFYFIFFFESRR